MANPNSVYEKVCPVTTYESIAEETAKFIDQEGKGTDVVKELVSDKISADSLERLLSVGGEALHSFLHCHAPEWKNRKPSDKFDKLMEFVLEGYYDLSSDTPPKVVCTKEEKHDWYILRKLDSYITRRLYQEVVYSDAKKQCDRDKFIQLLKADMDYLKNNNIGKLRDISLRVFDPMCGDNPKRASVELEILYREFILDPNNNDVTRKKLYLIYQEVLKEEVNKESAGR